MNLDRSTLTFISSPNATLEKNLHQVLALAREIKKEGGVKRFLRVVRAKRAAKIRWSRKRWRLTPEDEKFIFGRK